LNVERAAPERRAPSAQLEILEQAIDFPSQAVEWPPLGGTIGLLFRDGGWLGCNFIHVNSLLSNSPMHEQTRWKLAGLHQIGRRFRRANAAKSCSNRLAMDLVKLHH
jgi:hypothetical protein